MSFLEILEAVEEGKNLLLIGPGGVGKSYLLRVIAGIMSKDHKKNVGVTATTGIAALNIKGSTLHRWAGLGLATEPIERLVLKVSLDHKVVTRIQSCDVLIVDEISMLGYELVKKVDWIFKVIRDCIDKPFGGIQLIFSGDFLQLPPVKDHWPFLNKRWKEANFEPFVLEKPKRFTDTEFFEMLLRIRKGKPSANDLQKLKERFEAYGKLMKDQFNIPVKGEEKMCIICLEEFENNSHQHTTNCGHRFHLSCIDKWSAGKGAHSTCPVCRENLKIRPTILYSKKVDVSKHNLKELEKCPGPTILFHAKDTIHSLNPHRTEYLSQTTISVYKSLLEESIPSIVTLRIGAQVMLKANISVEEGLVNGSRGVVIDLLKNDIESWVLVKFMDGREIKITAWSWEYTQNDDVYCVRSQIPLVLAYSITIHKSQSATLDCVVCDLGHSVFTTGQAYVALSRVRCLDGLYLSNFSPGAIKADEVAVKYHDEQALKYEQREEVVYDCEDEQGNPINPDDVMSQYIQRLRIDVS